MLKLCMQVTTRSGTNAKSASKRAHKTGWTRALGMVCTLALGAGTVCAPALANDTDVSGKYKISLRGFHIAYATISLKSVGNDFEIGVEAKVTGLASLVSSGSASVQSTGHISRKKLVSDDFTLITKAKGETFTLKYTARRGRVGSVLIEPPLVENTSRVSIRQSHLTGITDPMSVFVIKAKKLDKSVCNTTTKVFTGIERYNLTLSFAEMQEATSRHSDYRGPVVLCNMKYIPVSGHFGSSQMTRYMQDNQRFLVWFAPLEGTDYLIPYRVVIGTQYGDLSMVLSKLKNKIPEETQAKN